MECGACVTPSFPSLGLLSSPLRKQCNLIGLAPCVDDALHDEQAGRPMYCHHVCHVQRRNKGTPCPQPSPSRPLIYAVLGQMQTPLLQAGVFRNKSCSNLRASLLGCHANNCLATQTLGRGYTSTSAHTTLPALKGTANRFLSSICSLSQMKGHHIKQPERKRFR